MVNKALNTMRDFLNGKYDPLDFSYGFPDFLVEYYNAMYAENPEITEILNDNMPEICAEYELDAPDEDFKKKVRIEYERAIRIF